MKREYLWADSNFKEWMRRYYKLWWLIFFITQLNLGVSIFIESWWLFGINILPYIHSLRVIFSYNRRGINKDYKKYKGMKNG